MRYGLKFNDTHSKDLDLVMKSVDRSLLPALRKRKVVVPHRHGSYDFGANKYDDRVITVIFKYPNLTLEALRIKARQIAAWLSVLDEDKALIFDDEPDKYYLGRVYEAVSLAHFMNTGQFTVTFECQPFAFGEENTTVLTGITGSQTIILVNNGTEETNPMITITGTADSITIGTLTIASITNTTVIDNAEYIVYSTVGGVNTNKLSHMSGDFLTLQPGQNEIEISGTNLAIALEITFSDKYK